MVMSPEESTQDCDVQIIIMNMLKNLRKDMNKFQNENKEKATILLNEIRKTVQEYNKEIEILKKIKTEVNFVIKN